MKRPRNQASSDLTIQVPGWQIAIVLLLPLAFVANGHSPWADAFWGNEDRPYYYIFWSSVAVIWATIAFLGVRFMRDAGVGMSQIGFHLSVRSSVYVIAALVALGLLAVLFRELVPYEMTDNSGLQRGGPTDLWERLFWVPMFIGAGIFEEIIFRGFAIPALQGKGMSVWVAVLISTASFSLITGGTSWVITAVTFVIGLLFAAIYLWKRNLAFVMIVHALADWSLLVLP